ncbi:MAG: FAD-dependent oxidoreductase [Pirellulales bacterium]|nr:FAD-dependent oxidoreductase [Pirellulales bacterium]
MSSAVIQQNSVWLNFNRQSFPQLNAPINVDVAIIGGGITGLTAGYLLTQAGKKVAILEKGQIGGAETGHTTAHLTLITDEPLANLVSNFGKRGAQLAWQGGKIAIDVIEAVVAQERLACDFKRVPNYVHASLVDNQDERGELRKFAELANELGFNGEFMEDVPLVHQPGVRFADQGLFHPIKYLDGVAGAITRQGGSIYEHSEVTQVHDDPLILIANGLEIRCQKMIVATHSPMQGVENLLSALILQTKVAAYNTYAVGGKISHQTLDAASFYDTSEPYNYLRVENDGTDSYAILGGMDHKTGQNDEEVDYHARLEELLTQLLPEVAIDHHWTGQVLEPLDGLPYIGPVNAEQFVATGYAGNGMTFGTLSGMMAADWFLGKNNPWEQLFQAERINVSTAWNYLVENKDYPWYLIKGFMSTPAAQSIQEILVGEGKILILNGERAAVYRQADGGVAACSAVCPHMGCVVRWNHEDTTWDCPCHGSRFNTEGMVLAGPAEKPLKPLMFQ